MANEELERRGRTTDATGMTAAVERSSGDEFPSFDLVGKKAFVTGATKGLGRHAAVTLAHAGADMFLTGRDEGELAECVREVPARGRRAESMAADLADIGKVVRLGEAAVEVMGVWTYCSTTLA